MDSAALYATLMDTTVAAAPKFLGLSIAAYKQILLILLPLILAAVAYIGVKRNEETDHYYPTAGAALSGMEAQQLRNKEAERRMLILYPVFALIISGLSALFLGSWIWGAVALLIFAAWYAVSYSSRASSIERRAKSRPLGQSENPRLYRLLGNVCSSCGVDKPPSINVIESRSLNAFSSGMKDGEYAITLTTGMLGMMSAEELASVLAHELAHIRNGDVRVMTLSLIFNSIYRALPIALGRVARPMLRGSGGGGAGAACLAVIVAIFWIPTLFINCVATLMHFAITRKREFIADAAAAQFIGRPWALASALKKIHENGYVDGIDNEDLAGMFISDPCDEAGPSRDRDKEHWTDRLRTFNGMMATHPDIRLRIRVLEQLDERTDVAYKTKTTVFK